MEMARNNKARFNDLREKKELLKDVETKSILRSLFVFTNDICSNTGPETDKKRVYFFTIYIYKKKADNSDLLQNIFVIIVTKLMVTHRIVFVKIRDRIRESRIRLP